MKIITTDIRRSTNSLMVSTLNAELRNKLDPELAFKFTTEVEIVLQTQIGRLLSDPAYIHFNFKLIDYEEQC